MHYLTLTILNNECINNSILYYLAMIRTRFVRNLAPSWWIFALVTFLTFRSDLLLRYSYIMHDLWYTNILKENWSDITLAAVFCGCSMCAFWKKKGLYSMHPFRGEYLSDQYLMDIANLSKWVYTNKNGLRLLLLMLPVIYLNALFSS